MEKKLSSIDWLALYIKGISSLNSDEIIEKAKAMHKEEMKESYREGRSDQQSSNDSFYNRNARLYYNETFIQTKN